MLIKSKESEWRFYNMYKRIADAMQSEAGAFTINMESTDSKELRALNLCLTPGGYTKKLLEMYPITIKICGITLAESDGGHEVLVKSPQVEIEYLDMNLLALEYGVSLLSIPTNHPDAGRFCANAPFAGLDFDIVVGDGAVLRSHLRAEYRQDKDREGLRLRIAQLIFRMARIKSGGTFIILLHRIDSWENLELLRNFEQFSKVTVWKSSKIYTQSSSYYLIAKDVLPDHPAAMQVVERWKKVWWTTTFGGQDGMGSTPEQPSSEQVAQALEIYGRRFIEYGNPIWLAQAEGLSKASYIDSTDGTQLKAGEKKRPDKCSSLRQYGTEQNKRFPMYMGEKQWLSSPPNRNLPLPSKKIHHRP